MQRHAAELKLPEIVEWIGKAIEEMKKNGTSNAKANKTYELFTPSAAFSLRRSTPSPFVQVIPEAMRMIFIWTRTLLMKPSETGLAPPKPDSRLEYTAAVL